MSTSPPIRVVSKRREAGAVVARADELVIDGDRTNPILGNRHVLSHYANEDERTRVIAAYVRDLNEDIGRNGPMSRAIDEIVAHMKAGRRVALRCWCAPRPCHLDHVRDEALRRFGCEPVAGPAQAALPFEATDVEI